MANLLSLEQWRKYFGYNPFHFWGLANAKVPVTSGCNTLVYEYAWQHADAVGRAEIAQAIESAESRLLEYLGYAPAPRYTEKTIPFPTYNDVAVWARGNPQGRANSVSLHDGYLQAVGVELITKIGDVNVVITDTDSDGVNDTFTASIATTETDPNRLAVYFTAADRLDMEDHSERWRIVPAAISISAGTATVRGRSYLLVKPVLREGVAVDDAVLDPAAATNYVTQVEISTRVTNTNGQLSTDAQAVLLWEAPTWPSCCDSFVYLPSTLDPAAVGTAVARVGIRDAKLGEVIPVQALYDTATGLWTGVYPWCTYNPDRVTVRYLAGYPLENGTMARKWQVIVARFAAAELVRRICACDNANQELYAWQFDVARAAGANDEQYQISTSDLDNPFGTRRGQVWAWKQVRNLRLGAGVLV